MMKHWLVHGPLRCVQVLAYGCGGILFPLHLGWIGASWSEFAAYLIIASLLLSLPAAILVRPLFHPVWQVILLVAAPNLLLLAVPATFAFWLGSTAGPMDEVMEETMCAAQGMAEADTAEADANDSVDIIPDCVPSASPSSPDASSPEFDLGS